MTEVYSVLNRAPSDDFGFIPIIFAVFGGVFLLISLFNLYKTIITKKVSISRILISIFMVCFIIVWLSLAIWGFSGDKKTYEEYRNALECNTCLVESGTPENLEIYRDRTGDGYEEYEITFYLNGKYFDSCNAYGGGTFSKRDIELIRNCETIKVKYIVDEYSDYIILSLSVGEKTDQD